METLQQKESLTDLTRKGTCLAFFSAYQDLDIEAMLALCDPAGSFWLRPLGPDPQGTLGEAGRNFWLGVVDAFPDVDNTIDTFDVSGDEVTCHVVIFGTQAKDFAGIPSKGQRFHSEHIFIFRFDGEDRIKGVTIDWDLARFQKQLGA